MNIEKMRQHNIFQKVLAVLIALVLWIYVASIENPITEKSYQVPIAIEGLNEAYLADLSDHQVNLTIEGRRSDLLNLNPSSLTAYVDLSEAHIGENTVEIEVRGLHHMSLLRASPAQVTALVTKKLEKTLPLSVHKVGQLAPGLTLGEVLISPKKVKIFGSAQLLKSAKEAVVEVDLSEYKSSFNGSLPIKILDDNGNQMSLLGIALDRKDADISMEIKNGGDDVWATVEPVFTGELPLGFIMQEYSVDPTKVELRGDKDLLKDLVSIKTAPISLDGIQESQTITTNVILPDGVTIKDAKPIEVHLVIGKGSSSDKSITMPIDIVGMPASGSATLSTSSVEVMMPQSAEFPKNAYVNVDGLDPGTYELPIRFKTGTAKITIPKTVTVNIK